MAKVQLAIPLNDAESDYDQLTPGVHNVEIKEGEINDSKSTPGEKVAAYKFVVLDGPDAGKHNKIQIALAKKALWKARQFRDACGVNDGGSPEYDTDSYIGRRLKVQVSQQPFIDQQKGTTTMRTSVDDFFPYGM